MLDSTASILSLAAAVGCLLLATALAGVLVQWRRRKVARSRPPAQGRSLAGSAPPDEVQTAATVAARTMDHMPDLKLAAKLRSGRQGDRPSEDDIVRERMGPRGRPGEPARAYDLRESETQMSKDLDPGHTA